MSIVSISDRKRVYLGVKKKVEPRIQARYLHVTLHKLINGSLDYWLDKAKTFRSNVVASLVGLEGNHEEKKGIHAHIVIQFSTRQQLKRHQFVKHFCTDSLHVSVPTNKNDLLNVLGYTSKTGNTKQYGIFTHRSIELDTNPEVYRFQYLVRNVDDGLRYFKKVIDENLHKDKNIIEKYAKRKDSIGGWLQKYPGHTCTLIKLANTWHLGYRNKQKLGFKYASFVEDTKAIRAAYKVYLKGFPAVFEKYLPDKSDLKLEPDYDQHIAHDLKMLDNILVVLRIALRDGPRRPLKALNLYLWSRSPSFGKTRLMNFLDAHMMAYRLPDDQWYVDYENDLYYILVSDEAQSFLRSKDYSHLKLILEGQRVEFNLKGREKVMKEDNPLIVLAENEPFDTIMRRYFSIKYQEDVMATRVLSIELKSRATLHFLLDRCLIPEC